MRTFLVLCVAISLCAQSPAPPRTPGIVSEGQQKKGSQKQTKAAGDNHVSEPTPAMPDEPIANHETGAVNSKSTKAGEASATSDAPNLLLVFFTGALALVAYLQWKSMKRQVTIMERQTEIIDGSLRVAKGSLEELKTYVGLTAKLAVSAETSATAVVESNNLATRSFLLAHRPKIIITGIRFLAGGAAIKEGSTMEGEFSIYNAGETE